MLVYRITVTKYANQLIASGRAARWNPNEVEMIYTASSRSLACLENVVHRDKFGLSMLFSIMTIECPSSLKIKTVNLKDLPTNWIDYDQMTITQRIGEEWTKNKESAILQVPSSIVSEEVNYLINPKHPDFKLITVLKTQPFVFDSRIRL